MDELLAAVRQGDEGAATQLYQLLFHDLYRHLGYLTHDPAVAEDLVQETFARAFANLDRFQGRSSFTTWIYGIAINLVRKHWRERQRRERAYGRLERQLALHPVGEDSRVAFMRAQRASALLEVLETLPAKLREAYVLCDLRQLPREQAAKQLNITPGNLAVRASRARARIRDELTRLGWMVSNSEGESG